MLQRFLPQPSDTQALGAQLARVCPEYCVIFLQGPLGAGKTTFAQGFLRALGDFKRIKSPTYTLVETYTTTDRRVLHFDLYRVENPNELEPLGLRDYTQEPAIWLIEWPEKAKAEDGSVLLPSVDLIVQLSLLPDGHAVQIMPKTELGATLIRELG